jgi:hypothetical protein
VQLAFVQSTTSFGFVVFGPIEQLFVKMRVHVLPYQLWEGSDHHTWVYIRLS